MSTCAAPVGSPCWTSKDKVTIQYHTARFRLVPQLAKVLSVPTPAVRRPGSVWTELPRPASTNAEPVGHVRLGYARASTARQSLDAQLDSLSEAEVTRVFSEKISTRATLRPELEAAVKLASEIRSSGVAVTLVVHDHKRLGRGIELAMLAEELKANDVGLEFLTGELKGSHDPSGIVFTVLARHVPDGARVHPRPHSRRPRVCPQVRQDHRRGRRHRRIHAVHGPPPARPGDEPARHRQATRHHHRREKGRHPSPATVMRMLREHDA
ncbi:recombinase family protein [Streptomyces nojiriensis]|uniref:recombinase family protein n=1 Tax=Streptomyces nojiriensis TaxID=66374 RepID=UPI0035DE6371